MPESSVRKVVQDALDAFARELAPYKRVSELILTDAPLSKTALQKIARGQLRDSYSFDLKRWEESALEQMSLAADQPEVSTDGHAETEPED